MLITRKSRKRGGPFRSRFAEGLAEFPVRQYQRCREDFYSGIVQAGVLAALTITLSVFGFTIWRAMQVHADSLNPWYERLIAAGLFGLVLAGAWRLWRKIRELQDIRYDLMQLKRQLNDMDDRRV